MIKYCSIVIGYKGLTIVKNSKFRHGDFRNLVVEKTMNSLREKRARLRVREIKVILKL